MKKLLITWGGLLFAIYAFGQDNAGTEAGCDCPSCMAEAAGETLPYTLPALQQLNEPQAATNASKQGAHDAHAGCDHDHHDHAEEAGHDEHAGHDHDHEAHAAHDHGEEANPHAGHDHGEVEGVEISAEMAGKMGLKIRQAKGGTISKSAVFPAEIKLNRDRTAAVSPRYASIVRQVFAEIGDEVGKDDVLASLENRETMAVYTVAASFDGTIISKSLAVGEIAGDDKVLFEVADLSTVWADISIFPKYQHLIRKGMPVRFIAPGGRTARGKVEYISPIVSPETRTFTARCVLKGAGEGFAPGAFVRAKIAAESVEAAVVVPRAAVQTLEGTTIIFVPGDHGFQSRDVVLGLADDHSVEITKGLKLGDSYVAAGSFALKAQMVTSGMDPHAGHGH